MKFLRNKYNFMFSTKLIGIFLVLILCIAARGESQIIQKISREQFDADCRILKKSLEELHPGLYRYNDRQSIERSYAKLTAIEGDSISIQDAFLDISEFLATIKCGHTYANPNNQNENISERILKGKNKLPFTFTLIGKKMIIENDVSGEDLGKGSEIFEINGIAVEKIIEDLSKYSDGDGGNEGQRLNNLRVTGLGEYEFFDIYFPLLVPPVDGKYEIEYSDLRSRAGFLVAGVNAISREDRKAKLEKEFGLKEESFDEEWKFEILDKNTGLLRIGTFVTYKMKLDWKKFLNDAFEELNKQRIPNLIIDIRGNAGGTTEVAAEIASHIAEKPIDLMMENRLVSYVKVPDNLVQYLSTWDNSFKDRTGTVEKYDERLYVLRDQSGSSNVILPKENAYRGKVYLLVDAANSSATFILAKILKENGLATLVGQTTGGNQRGINGGQIMFLDLPNSGIEIDIPLIGYFPDGELPDAGLEPDIRIEKNNKDIAVGKDTELEYVKKLIEPK